jgi:hypothetical protein
MSTAAKEGNGGAAGTRHVPVQRKRHVRLLSNLQPEKRRDVSRWLMAADLGDAAKPAAVRLGSARPTINLHNRRIDDGVAYALRFEQTVSQ